VKSTDKGCQIIHADDIKFVDSKVVSETGAADEIVDAKVEGLNH
jgi:hypothetical protein